ncbi:MAG: glycine--tRNA ligase subunit beta [Zetaproteobacteria bacterium]|nr:glycine--tRNA ligase subunit beta [Zetaproteobacteria bacterium]
MSMQPLLIEIGVEEIPAGVSLSMAEALRKEVCQLLEQAELLPQVLKMGVTPRRLLLHAPACLTLQPDREVEIWGPPEAVAFKAGVATPAAIGFAKKSGLPIEAFDLCDKGDGKARYMHAMQSIAGRATVVILAEAIANILRNLPSPKRMQWQDGETRSDAFIRPVRWIVARLGEVVIPFSFAGVESGLISYGHRIHGSSGEISLEDPMGWLESQSVIVDRERRKAMVQQQLQDAAQHAGVVLVDDAELLDEVVDLVEWPHVIVGKYDAAYLRLPEQVARIVLKSHQRCFTAKNSDDSVSHIFFTVANIQSKRPESVAEGNAKVVNARLADAAFYFDRDPKTSLEARIDSLTQRVFQEGLGTVGDQVLRLQSLAADLAPNWGVDAALAARAARLCKSDLTTGLVAEFTELQGYMGGVYARLDGEDPQVADAIAMHYQPENADDDLPASMLASVIGVAERLDKLLGYFHVGRIPTASADPFGLRRSAIALIRLLLDAEARVDLSLGALLQTSVAAWQSQGVIIAEETVAQLHQFIDERLLGLSDYLNVNRLALVAAQQANQERSLFQLLEVARLLTEFAASETGQAVAAANKRIANILKKSAVEDGIVDAECLVEDAEKILYVALCEAEIHFPDAPAAQLTLLASLREPVDAFFDGVMVMADDLALRENRLAILARLRVLFLRLADLSCLGA